MSHVNDWTMSELMLVDQRVGGFFFWVICNPILVDSLSVIIYIPYYGFPFYDYLHAHVHEFFFWCLHILPYLGILLGKYDYLLCKMESIIEQAIIYSFILVLSLFSTSSII